MSRRLTHTRPGNFYVNDKPTGADRRPAALRRRPRQSGTNDKAGSKANLMRWVSTRTIKETFEPAKDWRYPFLEEA